MSYRDLEARIALWNCPIKARGPEQSLVWVAQRRGITLGKGAPLHRGQFQERDEAALTPGGGRMSVQFLQEDVETHDIHSGSL